MKKRWAIAKEKGDDVCRDAFSGGTESERQNERERRAMNPQGAIGSPPSISSPLMSPQQQQELIVEETMIGRKRALWTGIGIVVILLLVVVLMLYYLGSHWSCTGERATSGKETCRRQFFPCHGCYGSDKTCKAACGHCPACPSCGGDGSGTATPSVLAAGTYTLTSKNTGQCLADRAATGSTTASAYGPIRTLPAPCSSYGDEAAWTLSTVASSNSGTEFRISNVKHGGCLAEPAAASERKDSVHSWSLEDWPAASCGTDSSVWVASEPNGAGNGWRFRNKKSGRCLAYNPTVSSTSSTSRGATGGSSTSSTSHGASGATGGSVTATATASGTTAACVLINGQQRADCQAQEHVATTVACSDTAALWTVTVR